MKIPQSSKEIGDFCIEVAEQCNVSVPKRVNDSILWRSYMLDGAPPGKQALFNKTGIHIDQLASELYSPGDLRFMLEKSRGALSSIEPLLEEAGNVLTDHFQNDKIAMAWGLAMPWALALGKAFIKLDWKTTYNAEHVPQGGLLKPYVVMPYEIGVHREDFENLDDQEAICQTFYLSFEEFLRRIKGHPKEDSIRRKVEGKMGGSDYDESERGYHRIFMGGTQPIITQGSPQPAGFASLRPNAPTAQVSEEVASKIVKMMELWVWDDERDDWTTLQFVSGGIMVEGELQHQNLFAPGLLPFAELCPNPVPGNFWGLSEIAPLRKLQDALNDRIADVLYLQEMEIRRPRAFINFPTLSDEKYAKITTPGGYITENEPNAKIEDLAPKVEGDVFQSIQQLIDMFDKVAGFTPVASGEGTSGVRSQGHAETLVRQSSPRIRDRALLLEHQLAELGSLAFKVLQQKDARPHVSHDGKEFYLKTLEDDQFSVTVDAHSSSPIFAHDSLQLALFLKNAGAIDAEDLLRLTHPPLYTTLLSRLRQREAAKQKLIAEHPELALEGGRGGHKGAKLPKV